ncbi:MAG: ABC transporter permease [Gemmiger qucibialis]
MKNIVHTLTLAQMRANPRRTLVTLVGVVLSVTMLTAVFAGADSFLNLLYRQAAQDNGTWHGRAFETGEQVVENLSQDDRIDQLGLAASWGVSPLDDSNRWGPALYGVNQSFYQLLRVECLEGNLPSTENELAISQTLAKKTGWKIGDEVSLDLLRVWTPQGVDSAGEMIYRQTSGRESWDYRTAICSVLWGKNSSRLQLLWTPGGFDDQNVFAWEPCFTVLEDQIPPDGLWCAYYTVSSLGRELYDLLESIQEWQADLPVDAGGVGPLI